MNELDMVKIRSYARLIGAKRRTIEDVPEVYKEAVKEYIKEQQA